MISIIIPIFNRAHLITETINSILAQTYTDWECIIVDDWSTDQTLEVLAQLTHSDSRFKVYQRPKGLNKGPSACRNYGISKSSGTYIQFFDSDDVMHPKHLELKMANIDTADMIICKLMPFQEVFTETLYTKETDEVLKLYDNNFEAFATGHLEIMMVSPMWKRVVLEKFLPIREDLHLLEDHDLHARALFTGLTIKIINKSLIYYRRNTSSTTTNFFKNLDTGLASYLEAKATVLKLSDSKKIKTAILKNILGYFRMALAARNIKAANTCLKYISLKNLDYNLLLQLKMLRIRFFYAIFKIFKKGDTYFKPLFKI